MNDGRQCWEVTYRQGGTDYTVYGWLTKDELLENISEMQDDSSVSNLGYMPANATDKSSCAQLYDAAK